MLGIVFAKKNDYAIMVVLWAELNLPGFIGAVYFPCLDRSVPFATIHSLVAHPGALSGVLSGALFG